MSGVISCAAVTESVDITCPACETQVADLYPLSSGAQVQVQIYS